MAELVGDHFQSAKEFIDLVRKKVGTKGYTYSLNKEMLQVEVATGRTPRAAHGRTIRP